MANNNPDKKSMGWFKGVLSNQNEDDQLTPPVQHEATEPVEQTSQAEAEEKHEHANMNILSRENKDKVSLDLIVSVENMLKDRQLILYKKQDLTSQLENANDSISRLRQDQAKKEQLLEEKSKEIEDLEERLTSKQMAYDQLLEDYKESQNNATKEFEDISNQLEKEINRYNMLNEESTNAQYESMLKIKDLEATIRNLEIENKKYEEKYKEIVTEKNELMQTINDFTERMSFSFSRKSSSTESE